MKTIPRIFSEIRPSLFLENEVGLFAIRDLVAGDVIARANEYDATFCTFEDVNELDPLTLKKVHDFCLGTPVGYYIPDNLNHLSTAWYMNHSCEPNVVFNDDGDFVAKDNVIAGTELRWDYGYGETNPAFEMECLCGTKSCRKRITGNDWLDTDFRRLNEHYFLPELRSIDN